MPRKLNDPVIEYRLSADRCRKNAAEEQLPMVRRRHLVAAERFEFLAQEVERCRTEMAAMFG
ncbi:MAG: hypothetical protein R3D89_06850 [Sphingomonadaceae bacterium]